MGSVKHLILPGSIDFIATKLMMDRALLEKAAKRYSAPTAMEFGMGGWATGGTYSVLDLKKLIPETTIENKAEALAMCTSAFFEHLANVHPDIKTCYLGMLDHDGNIVDVQTLLHRGEKSNIVMMRLAHTPDTYIKGDFSDKERLGMYRQAFQSGELQCCIADVESIFRLGFPLGSSTFESIFKAVGLDLDGEKGEKEYETWYNSLGTYAENVEALDQLRATVEEKGLSQFPALQKVLSKYGLDDKIPNPGHVLKKPVYDSTTKFEKAGDRKISKEEERKLSGLNDEGYALWTQDIFPRVANTQISFCDGVALFNIDGKDEVAAYRKMPWLTDYACTQDENRLMIFVQRPDGIWAIPSNKEIARGVFRKEGIAAAKKEAIDRASDAGNADNWHAYFNDVCKERKINVQEVSDYSCKLMSYAIAETANRILGMRIFDAKPLEEWVDYFMPFASKIEKQE